MNTRIRNATGVKQSKRKKVSRPKAKTNEDMVFFPGSYLEGAPLTIRGYGRPGSCKLVVDSSFCILCSQVGIPVEKAPTIVAARNFPELVKQFELVREYLDLAFMPEEGVDLTSVFAS
jgi:hypothetical protein